MIYTLVYQVILLSTYDLIAANFIGSPEVNTKTGTQNHIPSHEETLLNSLNAFAASYESLPTSTDHASPPFKPSLKVFQAEGNFVPIKTNFHDMSGSLARVQDVNRASATALSSGTPVLMQYMPQMMQQGGIQYLQLIPTRPLIVPLNPYVSSNNAPPIAASPYTVPQIPAEPATAEFSGRSPVQQSILQETNSRPDSQIYGNSLLSYNNGYRHNRDVEDRQSFNDLNLNINEYIPAHKETLQGFPTRGRP